MATWDDVGRIATALPEVVERQGRHGREWRVRDRLFAWGRPLRAADRAHLGAAAPDGSILAVRVPDLTAKDGLIDESPDVFFTTPHFDGHPIVLARLERVSPDALEGLVVDAWLDRAPRRLVAAYLDGAG